MTEKHFMVATAGHVDHGKSALVKALTGTDADRLPEEKARGITIDLGFAELNLSGPKGEQLHVGIVDVPGHESFVRNMIAGVGSIDLALFVVAADDGWMPQTEEHLQILTYLGVNHAIIALTKSDLGNVEETAREIHDQLRGTAFADSPIIATSIRTGDGLKDLRGALAVQLSTIKPQPDIGKPRLFVDRVFTLRGIGTVVTGTLTGGMLGRGQDVVVHPQNIPARIRSIQSHGRDLASARPGMRTAINLPDLPVGRTAIGLKRGDVLAPDSVESSSTLGVVLEKSPRLRETDPAARPLKTGMAIYLYHGTKRVGAKVFLLESGMLRHSARAIAQLRLDSPILAFLGDRFVMRDPSEQYTIAGGVVLDLDGNRESFRSAPQIKLLSTRVDRDNDVDVCVASEIARRGPMQRSTLLRNSRFNAREIKKAVQRLYRRNEIVIDREIAADVATCKALHGRAIKLIDGAHLKHPEKVGLDLNELRASLPDQHLFEWLIADLCQHEFVRAGSTIARQLHRPALPPQMRDVATKLRGVISATPFDPPARKQIAPDSQTRQVLGFLIEQGEVVEVGPDLVLSREAFARMKEAIAAFISKNGPATVSELRQTLQTSRRTIVPLLERLDRERVTRRMGDQRTLVDQIVASANTGLD